MGHKVHFIMLFFLMFIVVTALFSLLFIYQYFLFFVPAASASSFFPGASSPPSIQQFYGNVTFANGSLAEEVLVEVKFNESLLVSEYSQNGKYGYDPLFVVENLWDGDMIYFYLDSVEAANYSFSSFGFTNLNLRMSDVCGDDYCGRDETCSNCAEDCGICVEQINQESGGSSGGGGGSSGGVVPASQTVNNSKEEAEDLNGNIDAPENIASSTSGITGNVIADELVDNKLFVPIIVGLCILLVLIVAEILAVRRHHLKEISEGVK